MREQLSCMENIGMMIISHRGNLNGPIPEQENTEEYIYVAIYAGYTVEIDVRLEYDRLWLGHDCAEYYVNLEWLIFLKNHLWIHAKNFAALNVLIRHPLKVFFHEHEKHTIINNCGLIWSHDISGAAEHSIIPLIDEKSIYLFQPKPVYGICTDYTNIVKEQLY